MTESIELIFRKLHNRIRLFIERRKKPELEKIVNKLIRKAEKDMDREFQQWIKHYDEQTPVSVEEAEQILRSLLKHAAVRRDQLNERIVKSAETGALYERYYGGLERVYELNAKLETSMQEREYAQNDFDYTSRKFEEIRDLSETVTVRKKKDKNQSKKGGNAT